MLRGSRSAFVNTVSLLQYTIVLKTMHLYFLQEDKMYLGLYKLTMFPISSMRKEFREARRWYTTDHSISGM